MEQQNPPRVFVSYSWTTQDHTSRIVEWSERLARDGVDVLLDKWDLKEGQDKYAYMERMVTDPNVSKVLIFSDGEYTRKANEKQGGVGTESQIISQEVYGKVGQEKFVPIVVEFFEDGKPCLPVFLVNRIYLDFSSAEKYHENYEQLLRLIFNKPLYKKPQIGKPPQSIFEESRIVLATTSKFQTFKYALLNDKGTFRGLALEYLNLLFEELERFRISSPPADFPLDELVVKSIEDFLPFRNEFVEFVGLQVAFKNDSEIYEGIATFLEDVLKYKQRPQQAQLWGEAWADNYSFIIYELFLYLIALLIHKRKFTIADSFMERLYIAPTHQGQGPEAKNFVAFRADCESLETRSKRLKLNRLSIVADLMHQRSTLEGCPFVQVMQADFVLFLRSMFVQLKYYRWVPWTLVYASYTGVFELFLRATSHRDFENLKLLLRIENKAELIKKFQQTMTAQGVHNWPLFQMSHISFDQLMNLERLDTI